MHVNKIIEFPLRVFEGYDTAEKIKHSMGFVNSIVYELFTLMTNFNKLIKGYN